MVHAKCEYEKNRKSSTFRRSKIMLFRAFGLIWGGRKSLKIETFSQHEKSDLDMLYAVFASIQGVQKSIKIASEKIKKS